MNSWVELQCELAPEAVAAALDGRPGFAWLDSDGSDERPWSFLACDPIEVRRIDGLAEEPGLSLLDGLGEAERPGPLWIGYLGYDLCWSGHLPVNRWKARKSRSFSAEAPLAWFGRYDAVYAFDHEAQKAWIWADDAAAGQRLMDRLSGPGSELDANVGPLTATAQGVHKDAIGAALDAIAAGDIYQVNLARRWQGHFSGNPLALYLEMRRQSPVPLGLYLDLRQHQVLSRTMERFLRLQDGWLQTAPIKGTLARSGNDEAEAEALQRDPKERAEHAMIVDLMRNDLGRIAQTGTVRVEAPLRVESYRGLHHLVSTVRAKAAPEVGIREILEATFPPGSITGTPKVRAVRLIEELEGCPRGVYTGCLGYVDGRGNFDFAVAIRTAVTGSNRIRYWAGGGLVEASIAEREVAETELKAEVFLRAATRFQD